LPVIEWQFNYWLDGRESINERSDVTGRTWPETSSAQWVSGAVVILTRTDNDDGNQWQSLKTLSRRLDGRLQSTEMGQDIRSRQITVTETITWERDS
jgi:hypothetical protein